MMWALGPHLMAFGRNTGMILPETLVRFVPLVSNARVPGRAMVVVSLAVAVLTASAVRQWRARSRRPTAILVGVTLLVVVDYLPAPFPLVQLDRPAVYQTLRDRSEPGALCELPMGVVDGFGESGTLDRRLLFYQSIHERPIVGGFVARLPESVLAAYRADPLLGALLGLSDSGPGRRDAQALPDRSLAADMLQRDGIRFIMLNRSTASSALIEYVERVLPLERVAQDSDRTLYITKGK